MELSVNKPLKDAMKNEFITWYAKVFEQQLDQGIKLEAIKVDLCMSTVKHFKL